MKKKIKSGLIALLFLIISILIGFLTYRNSVLEEEYNKNIKLFLKENRVMLDSIDLYKDFCLSNKIHIYDRMTLYDYQEKTYLWIEKISRFMIMRAHHESIYTWCICPYYKNENIRTYEDLIKNIKLQNYYVFDQQKEDCNLEMINEILNLKKFPLLNNSDIKKCYTILNKEDKSEKYVSIDLIITNDDKLYMLIYEIPYSCW